jgi:RNA polymerase sigma-70 factor (sigma-E family)
MREPEGLRAFVTHASPQLLRSAWLLTRDWHAAEDLVQTALLKAIPRWRHIQRSDDPSVYVRAVMLNLFLTGRRRRWTGEHPTADLPEASSRPADAEDQTDLRLALLAVLAELPRQQRAVIVLRFFDDLTEAATAEVLGCSVGTVKSHTSRALARLREHAALRSLVTSEVPS